MTHIYYFLGGFLGVLSVVVIALLAVLMLFKHFWRGVTVDKVKNTRESGTPALFVGWGGGILNVVVPLGLMFLGVFIYAPDGVMEVFAAIWKPFAYLSISIVAFMWGWTDVRWTNRWSSSVVFGYSTAVIMVILFVKELSTMFL